MMAVWIKIKAAWQSLLTLESTPHQVALAFAIGVFVAFSPLLGIHTLLALLLGWIFRLNKVAILTGTLINNPITLVPICTASIWLGLRLIPDTVTWTVPIPWLASRLPQAVQPYLFAFIIGSLILGMGSAILAYVFIRLIRDRHASVWRSWFSNGFSRRFRGDS